ncbi:Ribbon-helix-helix protein, copG family [compost metagenome]
MSYKKKRGRPQSENPKATPLTMRLDDAEDKILTDYCKKHNVTRSDAVREAIQRLNDSSQNYFWTAEWREKLKGNEELFLQYSEQLSQAISQVILLIQEMNITSKQGSEQNEKIQN